MRMRIEEYHPEQSKDCCLEACQNRSRELITILDYKLHHSMKQRANQR